MEDISAYYGIDKNFRSEVFCEKLSNIFFRLRCAVSDGKLSEMSPYLTDDYYNSLESKLKADESRGELLYTERITVLGVEITGFEQDGENDIILAEVRNRIVEYYADAKTRKKIRGSSEEQFVTSKVRLVRPAGLVSAEAKGIRTQNCPYCGAPTNINKTAKCEYCGRILNTDLFDWLISGIS